MKIRIILVPCLLAMSGCTTHPPGPNPAVLESEVVRSSLNELCAAILYVRNNAKGTSDVSAAINQFGDNEGWIASVQVNLQTDIEGTFSPTATLTGPIIPGLLVPKGGGTGTFSTTVGGTGFDQTATTQRLDTHYVVISSLLKDDKLCPKSQQENYRIGFYANEGKYLTGKLGITEWVTEALSAQKFTSVISPNTLIKVQKQEPIVISRLVPGQGGPLLSGAEPIPPTNCPDVTHQSFWKPRLNSQIPDQKFSPGDNVSITTDFADPRQFSLTYAAVIEDQKTKRISSLPTWLKIDPLVGRIFASPIPPAKTLDLSEGQAIEYKIVVTATNHPPDSKNETECERFKLTITVPPTLTLLTSRSGLAWGPTYSGTFKFVIKANGQIGPMFSMDRVKGGSGTMFSMQRTETNSVLISFTPTGVNLTEALPANVIISSEALKTGRQRPFRQLSEAEALSVASGFQRLNDQMLRANLSNILSPF